MPKASQKTLEQTAVKQRSAASTCEPKSLATMFGIGEKIAIGDIEYELAPIPIKRLSEVGEAIANCPDMLMSHALVAATNNGEFDAHKTVAFFHTIAEQTEASATLPADQAILTALASGAMNVTSEEAEAMTRLIVLLLRRRHPDLTAEDLEDDLDIPTFLAVVCAMYQVNPNLKNRFSTPAAATGA
jgi:hypothetical protein